MWYRSITDHTHIHSGYVHFRKCPVLVLKYAVLASMARNGCFRMGRNDNAHTHDCFPIGSYQSHDLSLKKKKMASALTTSGVFSILIKNFMHCWPRCLWEQMLGSYILHFLIPHNTFYNYITPVYMCRDLAKWLNLFVPNNISPVVRKYVKIPLGCFFNKWSCHKWTVVALFFFFLYHLCQYKPGLASLKDDL